MRSLHQSTVFLKELIGQDTSRPLNNGPKMTCFVGVASSKKQCCQLCRAIELNLSVAFAFPCVDNLFRIRSGALVLSWEHFDNVRSIALLTTYWFR